ncbi:MAG: type I methionyl aminopeptidase [Myxococcaceae bacterium]|nr:type I methionyl aminopeptidase [Myxococcaceae bacterium]
MNVTVQPAVLPGPNEPCWCGSGTKYKKCHKSADAVELRKRAAETGTSGVRRVKPGVISPRRPVPPEIPRPDYAETGRRAPKSMDSLIMPPEKLVKMRRACAAAARVLKAAGEAVRPGITTDEIDAITHELYIREGGYPSTLNYPGGRGVAPYPKSLCTSVNEVVCHGIPDSRPLENGDIVNLDVTIYLDGFHGDCSATFLVGDVDEAGRRLVQVTKECLEIGIAAVKPGLPIRVIGQAIEPYANKHGYSVVRAYAGHGIGETFHTALQIPHHDDPEATTIMQPGMVFTIEPMISEGTWQVKHWSDGWTVVTADGKRSAQFEHTILVTETGAEILTTVSES